MDVKVEFGVHKIWTAPYGESRLRVIPRTARALHQSIVLRALMLKNRSTSDTQFLR